MNTLLHYYAFVEDGFKRPPCVPESQTGYGCGHYFAAKSEEMRDKCVALNGGKQNFDFYEAEGLYWFVWRAGCGGPTPLGFEKDGMQILKHEKDSSKWPSLKDEVELHD